MIVHNGVAAHIMVGDCVESMRKLPDQCVHTCVTSPPYFGLRDYGQDGQIGLESDPGAFVQALVAVFREVHRVLRDDGTVWLNLGDSYVRNPSKGGSGPNGKHDNIPDYGNARKKLAENAKVGSSDGAVGRGDRPGTRTRVDGLKEKDLIGIPWRVAFALQADGWHLRQDIIWHKPNPMPESVRDRCTKAHEYIFLLSKTPRYYYDHEAVKERSADPVKSAARYKSSFGGPKNQHLPESNQVHTRPIGKREFDGKRNRRDVWTVTSKPYKGAHFATFPPDLIEPCILAGCPAGGTVLDPFGGSGTTAGVALANGRNAIMCELNPDYAALMPDRVAAITGVK